MRTFYAIIMLVVFSYCHREIWHMQNLLRWIGELDGYLPRHHCYLVSSSLVPAQSVSDILTQASHLFCSVKAIRQRKPDERGWPQSCNSMFRLGAEHAKGRPFLWVEPDFIPLRTGWLNDIEDEYAVCGKPFMGVTPTKPLLHLTGCAVYPDDIGFYNPHTLLSDSMAWDAVEAQLTLPHVFCSTLFQHEWGDHEKNQAPTFRTQRSLRMLKPDACTLHRNKDHTLIKRLRERRRTPRWCRLKEMVGL